MKSLIFLIAALLCHPLLAQDDCPALLSKPDEVKRFGELRVKTIRGWDSFLTWALSPKNKAYHLSMPPNKTIYHGEAESLLHFVKNYGYFSVYYPIAGIVTDSTRDIKVTSCLLEALPTQIKNPFQETFSSEEIFAKVMAYRTLQKGMKIHFQNEIYTVDEVIDMWHGMPAFGLHPEKGSTAPPLLLYRGTDLNLASEKGWASILSDLDPAGSGLTTFLRAQPQIHAWLEKSGRAYGPARTIGFSLGGAFVLYTLLYEHELINKEIPSVAFNPPGVSGEILAKWNDLPPHKRPPHRTYVNQGDFVSQLGYFFSNVTLLSLQEPMGVIQAHTTLISAEPTFYTESVDVPSENASR